MIDVRLAWTKRSNASGRHNAICRHRKFLPAHFPGPLHQHKKQQFGIGRHVAKTDFGIWKKSDAAFSTLPEKSIPIESARAGHMITTNNAIAPNRLLKNILPSNPRIVGAWIWPKILSWQHHLQLRRKPSDVSRK